MPPAGYPAFLQYLQSGRVSESETTTEGSRTENSNHAETILRGFPYNTGTPHRRRALSQRKPDDFEGSVTTLRHLPRADPADRGTGDDQAATFGSRFGGLTASKTDAFNGVQAATVGAWRAVMAGLCRSVFPARY